MPPFPARLLAGLIALIAIGYAGIHAGGGAERAERTISTAVAASLNSAGNDWATPTIDGQSVVLSGIAPSPEAARAAEKAALKALGRGGIFFGAVTSVEANFAAPPPPEPPPITASTPPPVDANVDAIENILVREAAAAAALAACQREIDAVFAAGPITFRSASAAIAPASEALLAAAAVAIAPCPAALIVVEGHTDSTGIEEANLTLSAMRADAVAALLVAAGVDARRLRAQGAGSSKPAASNATAEGRARNRRIDVKLAPANAEMGEE